MLAFTLDNLQVSQPELKSQFTYETLNLALSQLRTFSTKKLNEQSNKLLYLMPESHPIFVT